MPNKITEKILEPSQKYVNSDFVLKVKAIRYATYKEIKERKVLELKKNTVRQLKGD